MEKCWIRTYKIKKENGWAPLDRPPAEWLNWLFNRTYAALKEIQDRGISVDELLDLSKNVDNKLGVKADQSYVETMLATAVSGAPKGFYNTVAALNTAYPQGTDGVFLVLENGHIYIWNGTMWADAGIYQSTGLSTGAVKLNNLADDVTKFKGKSVKVNSTLSTYEKQVATRLVFDVADINLVGKVINISYDVYTEDDNIRAYTTKINNATSPTTLVGAGGKVSTETLARKGEFQSINFSNQVMAADSDYLFVYIWAMANDQTILPASYYFKNLKVTIGGVTKLPIRYGFYSNADEVEGTGVIEDVEEQFPYNLATVNTVQTIASDKAQATVNERIDPLTKPFDGYNIQAKGNSTNPLKVQLVQTFDLQSISGLTTADTFKFEADIFSDDVNIDKLESQFFFNDTSTPSLGAISGTQITPSGTMEFIPGQTKYSITKTVSTTSYRYLHCILNVVLVDGTKQTSFDVSNIKVTVKEQNLTKIDGYYLYKVNATDVVTRVDFKDNQLPTVAYVKSLIQQVKPPSAYIPNNLDGKKLGGSGDSMMKGHTLSAEKTWIHKLASRNNMTYVNYGINGTFLTNRLYNGQKGLVERYVDMADDFDYLLFHVGTNDANALVPMGTDDSVDISTFKGALNVLGDGLLTKYPKAKMGFITPYLRNANYQAYVDAMVLMLGKYGIPVFNNIKNGGVCWTNAAQVSALTLGDGYHLNEVGMDRSSYTYEQFLRSL